MITVECSDGTLIDVDKEMAMSMSGAIRKKLEDKSFDELSTIVLDNISSNTLLKVLEFCSVHTSPQVNNIKVWDDKFVRLEPGELCELASAAYYLEIKPLVDLTCKAIAKLLKGKPPAEIRRTFNILYDFSPGDDVPPPTIRDKLRTKLHYKQKDKGISNSNGRIQEEPSVDTRSVDDLVSFIDGGEAKNRKDKKKGKKPKPNTNPNLRSENEASSLPASPNPSYKTKQPGTKQEKNKKTSIDHNKNKKDIFSFLLDDENWPYEDEEDIDPELKAAQDQEVEEFRKRLESIQTTGSRPKISVPFQGMQLSLNIETETKIHGKL